jgi:hypothetical protein
LRASKSGTDYSVIGFGTRKQLLLEAFPFLDREQRNSHRSDGSLTLLPFGPTP